MYAKMDTLVQLVDKLNNLKSETEQIAWIKIKNVSSEILNRAFSTAVINGFLPIVKALSKIPGVDPAADNNDAIQGAAQYGQLEVIKFLCTDPKVDPAVDDSNAICLAAQNDHLEVIEFLCTLPNIDPTADKDRAILAASEHKHPEVVNFLASLQCYNPYNPKIGLERKDEIIRLLTNLNMQKQLKYHEVVQSNLHLGFLFFKNVSNLECLGIDIRRKIGETALDLDYYSTEFKR
jgi:hypothetical protein